MKSDDPEISTLISTRASVEIIGLIDDGFTLDEAATVCILPLFDDKGSPSERTYMKQVVQKYLPTDLDDQNRPWDDDDDSVTDDDDSDMKTPW